MLGRVLATSSFVAAVTLLILLGNTTPTTVGPLGLLAVFFLLYVLFIGLVTAIIWSVSRLLSRISRMVTVRKPLGKISLRRSYYLASVLALAPVMMLAMKSIGSLGLYEVLLVTLFVGVAIFYVIRRDF
jgi:hypothetical protein